MRASIGCCMLGCFLLMHAGYGVAQSGPQLYGLIDTGITYVNRIYDSTTGRRNSQFSMHPGAIQASRFGMRATEDLGDGNKALFVLEGGFSPATGTSSQGGALFGRRAVVGLSNRYGTMLLGRQTDSLDDMGVYSSTVDFGSQVAPIHGLDRTSSQRTNNSVRLNLAQVGGSSLSAIYGFGGQSGSLSSGQSYGFGGQFTDGALKAGVAYYESKLGPLSSSDPSSNASYLSIGARPPAPGVSGKPGDTALRVFALGSSYQWGPARLYMLWSNIRQPLAVSGGARRLAGYSNDRTDVIDAGVSYAVTSALNLNVSAIYARAKFVGASSGKLTQFNIGADYFLSKRTDVYAVAAHINASNMDSPGLGQGAPGGSASQRQVRIGIRHKF